MTCTQLTIDDALAAGEAAIRQVSANAGKEFAEQAAAYVIYLLRSFGPMTREQLTDGCKAMGIRPHNDKAFGGVYKGLSRQGKIRSLGVSRRTKGHGSNGGNLWEVVG